VRDWVSVADAAAMLQVSARQVRNLVAAGVLPASRVGNSWLLDAQPVRSRSLHAPSAGRPLSLAMAWLMMSVVQRLLDAESADDVTDPLSPIADRQLRHRIRQLLAEPVPARRWRSWLGSRAERRRVWVHPGVLDRLARDERLRPGGPAAAHALGLAVAGGAVRRFYVNADVVDEVMAQYRAVANPDGQVELMVVPAGVGSVLLAGAGPVPEAVALADLLESDDAREQHAAASKLEHLTLAHA
jgi:excisionase family DNA binding protein